MLGFIEIGTKGWHLINFQKNLLIKNKSTLLKIKNNIKVENKNFMQKPFIFVTRGITGKNFRRIRVL